MVDTFFFIFYFLAFAIIASQSLISASSIISTDHFMLTVQCSTGPKVQVLSAPKYLGFAADEAKATVIAGMN